MIAFKANAFFYSRTESTFLCDVIIKRIIVLHCYIRQAHIAKYVLSLESSFNPTVGTCGTQAKCGRVNI